MYLKSLLSGTEAHLLQTRGHIFAGVMWQGFDAEQQRKSTQFGLELCPEGTVQLSQRSTTRYRPGRADLQRWPRRRTATSDACCQSAAIL